MMKLHHPFSPTASPGSSCYEKQSPLAAPWAFGHPLAWSARLSNHLASPSPLPPQRTHLTKERAEGRVRSTEARVGRTVMIRAITHACLPPRPPRSRTGFQRRAARTRCREATAPGTARTDARHGTARDAFDLTISSVRDCLGGQRTGRAWHRRNSVGGRGARSHQQRWSRSPAHSRTMIARAYEKDSARILHGPAEVDTRALPSCLLGPRVSSSHVRLYCSRLVSSPQHPVPTNGGDPYGERLDDGSFARDSTAVIGAGATMIAHED